MMDLAKDVYDSQVKPLAVGAMIVAGAEGNPFYLEEIVRDLIESGALEQDASTGRWRATQRIEKVSVPDTIQGLLIARIDRLDEDLKRVVRRAAVRAVNLELSQPSAGCRISPSSRRTPRPTR